MTASKDQSPAATNPEPVFIGYFARPTTRRTNWPNSMTVEEICSASICMSGCEWDWINEWRHNGMWVYDSPETALDVVPFEHRSRCDLYTSSKSGDGNAPDRY